MALAGSRTQDLDSWAANPHTLEGIRTAEDEHARLDGALIEADIR